MKSNDVIRNLSTRLGKSQKEVRVILQACTGVIKTELDEEKSIHLPGLGVFRTQLAKRRKSYDPFHKHFLLLPVKRTIEFRVSKKVRTVINSGR